MESASGTGGVLRRHQVIQEILNTERTYVGSMSTVISVSARRAEIHHQSMVH